MSGSRFVIPFVTVINAIGVPYPGAQLFFYASGTSTPLATYSDEDLTIPNSNPVVADSGGMFSNIWLQPLVYKVVLEDINGDEIWTADPVVPFIDLENDDVVYDLVVFLPGVPADGQVYPIFNIVRNCYLAVNLLDAIGSVVTNPTGAVTINILKNNAVVGTINVSIPGAVTYTFVNQIDFIPGDQFALQFPNPADATMAGFAITIPFTLGS